MVDLIQDVKCDDSLRAGQELSLDQVAKRAARLEPIWLREVLREFLNALVKGHV